MKKRKPSTINSVVIQIIDSLAAHRHRLHSAVSAAEGSRGVRVDVVLCMKKRYHQRSCSIGSLAAAEWAEWVVGSVLSVRTTFPVITGGNSLTVTRWWNV